MKPALLAIALLAVLAAPAAAKDALGGAVLQSATGQMSLTETRCAAGAAASDCGHVKLTNSFSAGPRPAASNTSGPAGFRNAVVVHGRSRGICSADSPPSIVTATDGSMQILAGAQRVEPANAKSTTIAFAAGARGARWAWLEPFDPSFTCTYFDEPATTIAVPLSAGLPRALTSRLIPPRVLHRSRFSVRVAGKQAWSSTASDGTTVTGSGTWTLTLNYARAGARPAPAFVASRDPMRPARPHS
jgi:hypothetical protein